MAQFDMKQMKRRKGEPLGNTLLQDALEVRRNLNPSQPGA
jgi:hypothetical protein